MRYFLEIAYKGTAYEGFQVQPGKATVQGTINEALSRILNTEISVTGAGRTDSGVHALQSYVHFDSEKELPNNLTYRLNKILPSDLAIGKLIPVADDAHARYDAVRRAYRYRIHFEKDPFRDGLSYYFPYPVIDLPLMQESASLFLKYEDYSMLSKFNPHNKSTLCSIFQSEIIEKENGRSLEYHVAANRFLHNMVRRMTGALLAIGRHSLRPEELEASLRNKISLPVNEVAPAEGLYLAEVQYPFIEKSKYH